MHGTCRNATVTLIAVALGHTLTLVRTRPSLCYISGSSDLPGSGYPRRLGAHLDMGTSNDTFVGVKYYIVPSIARELANQYRDVLGTSCIGSDIHISVTESSSTDANGATSVPLQSATHIITDTPLYEGFREIEGKDGVHAVTVTSSAVWSIDYSDRFSSDNLDRQEHDHGQGTSVRSPHQQLRPSSSHSCVRPEYYSPDPALTFSGVVACAHEIPKSDVRFTSPNSVA
jgi:hypothetical protein